LELILDELINKIENVSLRKKVMSIIYHKEIFIETEHKALNFKDTPGSIRHHHSYRGGLLDHIKSTTKIALVLCDTIESVNHGKINRDHVIAGVLLHDFMKLVTIKKRRQHVFVNNTRSET